MLLDGEVIIFIIIDKVFPWRVAAAVAISSSQFEKSYI